MLNQARMSDQNLPIEIITIDQFTRLVEEATMPDEANARQEPTSHEQNGAAPNVQADAMPMLDAVQKPARRFKPARSRAGCRAFASIRRCLWRVPVREPKPLLDIGRVQALLNKTPDQKTADSGVTQNDNARSALLTADLE